MRRIPFDYSIRNLARSPMRMTAIVAGSALVSTLIISAGAFLSGMNRAFELGGSTNNVLLLATGSEESVERSEIPANSASLLAASVPGLKESNGEAHVSPEVNVAIIARVDEDDTDRRAVVRGVTPAALLVHEQVRIVAGRMPRAGYDEILVGRFVAEKMGVTSDRLSEGSQVSFAGTNWTVVGTLAAPASVMEAEIWAPLTDLQIALKRDSLSAVTVTLDTAEFADIEAFTFRRFDLELSALRETEYYRGLIDFFRPVRMMILATALLVSLTGFFGGLTTLYAAFTARIREIGALQAIGFTRGAIVWSLIQESVFAASVGGILAATIGIGLIDGIAVRFSLGVFALHVDGAVVLAGVLASIGLGFFGALPPAFRCLRMPVTEALRSH